MKQSEHLIYITLVDFLLQLVFLGLVLAVIYATTQEGLVDGLEANQKDATERLADLQTLAGTNSYTTLKDTLTKLGPVSAAAEKLSQYDKLLEITGSEANAQAFLRKYSPKVDAAIEDLKAHTGIDDLTRLTDSIKKLGPWAKVEQNAKRGQKFETLEPAIIQTGGADAAKRVLESYQSAKKPIDEILSASPGITLEEELTKLASLRSAVQKVGGVKNAQAILEKSDIATQRLVELVRQNNSMPEFTALAEKLTRLAPAERSKKLSALAETDNQLRADKSNAPPYIELSEAKGFSFPTGDSELTDKAKTKLKDNVVKSIVDAVHTYRIDLIEVIGHTDGEPVDENKHRAGKPIDQGLEALAQTAYGKATPAIKHQSNADLGLLRALEVVRYLKSLHINGIDPQTGFRAYSAAQLTLRSGKFADANDRSSDQERRRIEIRLTRLGRAIKE